jgi:hypothetical protein
MAVRVRARRRALHGGARPRASGRAAAERRLGYLLVAPVLILLLAITAYPLISNLWNSFHFVNLSFGVLPHKFVGFRTTPRCSRRRNGGPPWDGRSSSRS